MEFEKLGKEDIRSMYDLMEEAFPEEERRKYEKHKQLYENGCFEIFGKKDETGKVIAVMSIWNLEDVRYAEHLRSPRQRFPRHTADGRRPAP